MRFIVCVKEVPESIDVKIDLKTNKIQEEGISTTLNPFDQFILEEALKLKKDEDEIIAISIGTPQTKMVLMKCLALGADKAILLSDNVFMGSDSFATAYTLSKVINKIGDFDIIFCGQQTVDGNTAQVGPELAVQLKIPQVTYVESVDKFEGQKLVVKSQTDDGFKIVESQIPVLLAGIPPSSFTPSLPPLRNIIAAQNKPCIIWNFEDLDGPKDKYGSTGSLIQITKVYYPPPREKGIVIVEEPTTAVEKLIELLNKDKVI